MKLCRICNCNKELIAFGKSSHHKDGYDNRCKACEKVRQQKVNAAKAEKAGRVYESREAHKQRLLDEAEQGIKVCSGCGETKARDEFNNNTASPDGLYSQCKTCSRKITLNHYYTKGKFQRKSPEYKANKRTSERKRRAELTKANPDWRAVENRKAMAKKLDMDFVVLESRYQELLETQSGRCAICGDEDKTLCIDHDHNTNEIRGLLCRSCNLGLGSFKDDPLKLHFGVAYVLNCC